MCRMVYQFELRIENFVYCNVQSARRRIVLLEQILSRNFANGCKSYFCFIRFPSPNSEWCKNYSSRFLVFENQCASIPLTAVLSQVSSPPSWSSSLNCVEAFWNPFSTQRMWWTHSHEISNVSTNILVQVNLPGFCLSWKLAFLSTNTCFFRYFSKPWITKLKPVYYFFQEFSCLFLVSIIFYQAEPVRAIRITIICKGDTEH